MIRTTVRLDEDIFKEARKKAIDEGKPFGELINDALYVYLNEPRKKKVKSGTEFLLKIIELGKKYPIKDAPKDLAQNHDKYLWGE